MNEIQSIVDKCRACLNKNANMRIMNEQNGLKSMFTSITHFQFIESDEMPIFLCLPCESQLKLAYTFQKQCQESQEIMQKFLSCDFSEIVKYENFLTDLSWDNPGDVKMEVVDNAQAHTKSDGIFETTDKLNNVENSDKIEISESAITKAINDLRNRNKHGRCVQCGLIVDKPMTLTSHFDIHHKDLMEKWCNQCNEIVDENLQDHKSSHVHQIMNCQFCGKKMKRKYLVDHIRSHSNTPRFKCRICNRRFSNATNCRVHYITHMRKPHACTNCSKSFAQRRKLEAHMRAHGAIACNQCNKRFENGEELNKHQCRLVEEVKKDLTLPPQNFCTICNKKVTSLVAHSQKFHGGLNPGNVNNAKYNCNFCEKTYKSETNLRNHLMTHSGEFPHKCRYCGKGCNSRSNLITHERIHTGEKPYICSICGKAFCQSSTLGTHMKQHSEKTVQCPICPRKFCRQIELKLHIQKHEGYRPYLCPHCGKSFSQQSHCNEHLKTHSDSRPYKCQYCDKAFKKKTLHKSHESIHLGHKPYKCEICDYRCQKPYRLAQHAKLHEEKPVANKNYSCRICSKAFSAKSLLNNHMSSMHNAIV